MDVNEYILTKYNLNDYKGKMPIELPIVREDFSVLFNELDYTKSNPESKYLNLL